jgi:cytochrome c5
MPLLFRAAALFLCAFLWASTQAASAHAEGSGETSPKRQRESGVQAAAGVQNSAPAADGKEILTRKCFQCHQASMWSSVRGDRKAWEGVLYRMVGRGALWTEAEIDAMAGFLAQTRGLK